MIVENVPFKSLLKSLRVRKGWTQEKTAQAIELKTTRTYIGWENDEGVPNPEHMKNIVALLAMSIEEENELYRKAMQFPPRVHNFPFRQNTLFTGRDAYLEQLHSSLNQTSSVALTQPVGISGQGGIGKTQLALEYAYRHYPKIYRTVLWVNAAERTTLQASYDTVTDKLKLPERHERNPDIRVRAVKHWLEKHTQWLLIMDNADDLPLINSFLPESPLGHIIITTRSQIVRDSNIGEQIIIDVMQPEEGATFLLRRDGKLSSKAVLDDAAVPIRNKALRLAELLGYHPLALDQAGGYIEETGIGLSDYIELYQEQRPFLLSGHGSTTHPEAVTATIELSFRRAVQRQPLAADILYFCSFLQPDAMPEEVCYQDSALQLTRITFNNVMGALRRYSLIHRNGEEHIFSMHRLVQAVLTDTMSVERKEHWRERAKTSVRASFPAEGGSLEWTKSEHLLIQLLHITYEDSKLPAHLDVTDIFYKTALFRQSQRRYAEAEELFLHVISVQERLLGEQHLDTALSLNSLARLYWLERKYEQAKALYQRSLHIHKKELGSDHPLTQETKNNYITLLRSNGHGAEAAALETDNEPAL